MILLIGVLILKNIKMSKRLPYFQFEPAEYLAGDIMCCSYSAQGVFSIIKSLYWQKDCVLTLSQVKKRCVNSDTFIKELIDENILKVTIDGFIDISFLSEQFNKATNKSSKNSEAGKKSAELKKLRKEINKMLEFVSLKTKVNLSSLQQRYNIKSTNVEFLLKQKSTIKIIEDNIRKEDINTNVDVDSFYDVDILKNYYLENDEVVNAIISNKDNKLSSKKQLEDRLTEFNEHIKQQGRLSENFKEYSKYFLNWNRKKKEIETRGESKVSVSEWEENPYKDS